MAASDAVFQQPVKTFVRFEPFVVKKPLLFKTFQAYVSIGESRATLNGGLRRSFSTAC